MRLIKPEPALNEQRPERYHIAFSILPGVAGGLALELQKGHSGIRSSFT
jgi:hypothetical protein